ncbi:MBL fold metallo-hydrolase [Ideonella margarita]|uniref:MBL fold metallo-hydrolase n=1 Tax=Ideonella margarita TaxID=2984191 RepID=A0ABU9C2W2_9BURK
MNSPLNKTLTTLAVAAAATLGQAHAAPLKLEVYNADANSFSVTSTLVTGEKEAMVIDAGFTRADALRIAAKVLDSGKQLTTIYVSQADPDYYFGVETLKQVFPDAKVLTTPAVLAKINAKLAAKMAFWPQRMGANAPRKPVLPEAFTGNTLTVDGERVELRGLQGVLAHRPYAWIPSAQAIVGNVGVFGQVHVWTADTQSAAERQAWVQQLDEMAALQPKVVVPGHMVAGTPMDASAIAYTRSYLTDWEKAVPAARDSAELIARTKAVYPKAVGELNLGIGAKVAKGEMAW